MNQSKVPIHTIGEERSVGFFDYEIGIRGKKYVESASRKMILNKTSDLIGKMANVVFCKCPTETTKTKELKLEWSEKMVGLQEKSFSEKDIINLKLENQKLKDLEFLRNQIPPGPFTKPEDVNTFMEDTPESKDKNNRMLIEIRFQKNTSTAIRKL